MITDSFDTSRPIISVDDFYKKRNHTCDICLITFSEKILHYVVQNFDCEIIKFRSKNFVYVFSYEGNKVGIFYTTMGAPASSMDMLAASNFIGSTKFILFGSAGSLDETLTNGKYVVPTQAYRDEGLSYHYAKASDYIEISKSKIVASILQDLQVPYIEGKIWTTDAFFMETENLYNKHKADGCLAVDMETSGLQAVCDFYNLELYCFLETGDVLSTASYSKKYLSKANNGLDKLFLALEIANRIK